MMSSWASSVRRRLKPLVSRQRGNLVALQITERGKHISALCPDDEVFTLARALVLDRIYERGGFTLTPDMGTAVDTGAHAGIFSLQVSQWARQVVSIEASKVNYDLLKLNIDRNGIENIYARYRALWSTSGQMLDLEDTGSSGCGRAKDPSEGATGGNAVESLSLDDLITEIGPIDLLKIDIEGAEYGALGACTKLSDIKTIVGELHLEDENDEPRLQALVTKLEEAGFHVRLITETELYSQESLSRLRKNRGSLQGNHLTKAIAAAYYLAQIEKPIRPADATYQLPILIARRSG
jgi:FkbM family methyltransferase